MRISDRMLHNTVRANLVANQRRMLEVEDEITSGKKVRRPSDDPSAVASILRHRADVAANAQDQRTVNSANSRLSAADSALATVTEILHRATELTVQAGSDAIGTSHLQSIGAEINELLKQTVQVGNTRFTGQYLFGGSKTTTPPFKAAAGDTPAGVTYEGNSEPVTYELDGGIKIRVDVPGDDALRSTLDALIAIRDKVNAGDGRGASEAGLPALDAALDQVLLVRGSVGARVNMLEETEARLGDQETNLKGLQSRLEDIDLADAMVRFNSARTTYEAALGAAAKVLQPTLVDYLR
jgi:flagellar hook-associated protein 3 FlgL